ncbi:hypothetical protein [Brevibacillus massiliensis]|uniref:hypothetical protein n=1 Tax=Brevibacillus massiliensis TaxID=1118054 RepID=UPI0002F93995|nr:hypothetical protein [Brevibacillus massiliensis]
MIPLQNPKEVSQAQAERVAEAKRKAAIPQLEQDTIDSMLALTEVYEKTDADTILLMQVMTELYEKNLELEARIAALEGGQP